MPGPRGSRQTVSSPKPTRDRACYFCERLAGPSEIQDRTICETARLHVSHELVEGEPTYLGYLLIQTKRHVPDLAALTNTEAHELGLLIQRISQALKICTDAEWTYVLGFMEAVQHVHVFVAARYPKTPKEYVRLGITEWPEAPKGDRAAVVELSRRLREWVRTSGQ